MPNAENKEVLPGGYPIYRGVVSVILLLTLYLAGCESQPTEVDDYQPELLLYGFLYNGMPVSEVFLQRIAPLRGFYDPQLSGVTGAAMRIYQIGGNDTLQLTDDPAYRGRYVPAAGGLLIPVGKQRYRIEVINGSEFLEAETVIPDTFRFVSIYLKDDAGNITPVREGDTLTRHHPNMYWEWSPCDSAGGYTGMIVALTPRDSLIRLDPEWDPATDSLEESERSRAGYTIMRDDQTMITIPWIFFEWEGPQRVTLLAISRDYYEYLFTTFRVQQGLIAEPQWNVRGGIGIFGGMARRSFRVVMKRTG